MSRPPHGGGAVTLLVDGEILTMDPTRPTEVAVADGRIVAVGDDLRARLPEATRHDLGGRTLGGREVYRAEEPAGQPTARTGPPSSPTIASGSTGRDTR